jgi:Smg protein
MSQEALTAAPRTPYALSVLDKPREMLLDAPALEPATVEFPVARTLPGESVAPMLSQPKLAGVWRALPGGRCGRIPCMMTDSVLDILIYVFDRYMLNETPDVPERERLARDLERVGFAPANVERALDWLADLAFGHAQAGEAVRTEGAAAGVRVFSDSELARLSTECRGLLLRLESAHVLTPQQREIVIERMLALDADEPDTEQLKWVVLMVLSSQPGQELAVERLGGLITDARLSAPH